MNLQMNQGKIEYERSTRNECVRYPPHNDTGKYKIETIFKFTYLGPEINIWNSNHRGEERYYCSQYMVLWN